jgi:peroxin-6
VVVGQSPTLWVVEEAGLLARDREGAEDCRALAALKSALTALPSDCVVVALTGELAATSASLAALFLHHHQLPELEQEDRRDLLDWLLLQRGAVLEQGGTLRLWARRAAGLNLADLEHLLDFAEDEAAFAGRTAIGEADLEAGLALLQGTRADCLGLATVPSVRWEEVGGLQEARAELARALEPAAGGRRGRTGVLLYGPPGVGKTLLAKAMATECACSFISVKGPELLNMYVGQSEENVRQVFARARQAQPCILFFDELDSLAPSRGGAGDGGGVMDRVVSALLAEMDQLERVEVTVVAATNRPDLVDPALLRPGRLDRLVYLGVTDDPAQQLLILTALTAKLQLAADCDLAHLAGLLPSGLTGADLSSLVSEAALGAVRRCIEGLEAGRGEDMGGVTMADFIDAVGELRPSVSPQELRHYEGLRSSLRK